MPSFVLLNQNTTLVNKDKCTIIQVSQLKSSPVVHESIAR